MTTERSLLASLILSGSCLHVQAQVTYVDKKVSVLQGFYDGADCIFFELEGVSQADPIKANDPTFAISRTQPGAKDAYALLMMAKVTGVAPLVRTRGNLICGYAGVAEIILQ